MVLGHNEHLYVRFPRGLLGWYLLVTCGLGLQGGLLVVSPAWAAHLHLLAAGQADLPALGLVGRGYGVTLLGLSNLLYAVYSTSDKVIIRSGLAVLVLTDVCALGTQLVHMFQELSNIMSVELTIAMLYGVMSQVSFMMYCVTIAQGKTSLSILPLLMVYLLAICTVLVGPCEVSHRAQVAATHRWELLLRLQRRHPQLAAEAALQREEAARELTSLGELGLFRLERSTLLSVTSTIVTYMIVVLQFQSSPPPGPVAVIDEGGPPENGVWSRWGWLHIGLRGLSAGVSLLYINLSRNYYAGVRKSPTPAPAIDVDARKKSL
ncbi:hypothetical protein FJT64_004846 [Amphibalanus amphitrite]|uniref:Uncharacterized protein n=1 Tax=Amphibalanus amphitrite TaxID=1232801 RepID=A0A6A4W6S4_AMPAM|nr:hypothetical protein FJT64_004846 [Amphibalanus amphitrite]